MKKLYTLIATVFLTASTFAQAPEKMSYQAVVRDAANALVTNTQVGMQISILQGGDLANPGPTIVYSETQTPTTNANGLVSLEIGTGTTTDDFTAIDWSAGPYFIQTGTDPAGGADYTITGTSQLLSVPYALYAKTSGSSNYAGTSSSSIDLSAYGNCSSPFFYPGCGYGTVTLTTNKALSYTAGMRVRLSESSNPTTKYLEGIVNSYDGSSMEINVDASYGDTTSSNWTINLGAGLPGVPGAMGPNGMVFGQGMSCRNFMAPNGPAPIGKSYSSKIQTYYSGSAYANFDVTLLLDSGSGGILNGTIINISESPTNSALSFFLVGSYTFPSDIPPNTIVSIPIPVFITGSTVLLEVSSENIASSAGIIEVCL